jgi:NADPH:quinone reductase-like Zn-dependent oxidoreductase
MFVQIGAPKRGGWIGIFARISNVMLRSRVLHQPVTFYVAQPKMEDLASLRDMIEAGTIRPAIDRTFPLAEAREAVRYVGTGQARAKVVITA